MLFLSCIFPARRLLALTSFLLGSVMVHAQRDDFNLKNPGDYNNFIIREMTITVQKNFEYIAFSVHSEEYDQLESKRTEVVAEIIKARRHVENMPPIDDDTRLRDEAVAVLEEYQRAFELDYEKIIGLKRKSRDSFEAMEAYFQAEDKAEEKVHLATKKLLQAQKVYAQRYNMDIVNSRGDDDLERKMNKVIAVNNYWRAIFLEYFRVSKQYDQMWDVLPSQKAVAIERERQLVSKVIHQVLPLLKSLPAYNEDHEFRDQTINIVEYYQLVATEKFRRIVELLNQKTLKQADVDEVNGIISQCNSDHDRLTYNWNIALQDLLRKNVDKE